MSLTRSPPFPPASKMGYPLAPDPRKTSSDFVRYQTDWLLDQLATFWHSTAQQVSPEGRSSSFSPPSPSDDLNGNRLVKSSWVSLGTGYLEIVADQQDAQQGACVEDSDARQCNVQYSVQEDDESARNTQQNS